MKIFHGAIEFPFLLPQRTKKFNNNNNKKINEIVKENSNNKRVTPECISATVILTLHSSFAYQWPQSYANEAHARRPGPSFLSFSLPSSSSSSSSSFIFLFFLFPFEISLKPASYITRNYRNMNKENTSSASYWLVKERKKGIQTYFDIYISIDILRNSLICILIPPPPSPTPAD